MEERIAAQFNDSIDVKIKALDDLTLIIADASEIIVQALVSENKLLVCGNGMSAALAQVLVSALANRYEQERPGLPAVLLGQDAATSTAINNDYSFAEIYSKQVRALGQPGDVLVIFSCEGSANNVAQAIGAAHDRQMQVIMMTGMDGGDCTALLDNHDLDIRVPSRNRARIHEVHLLTVFCLCDLIDQQLFGGH